MNVNLSSANHMEQIGTSVRIGLKSAMPLLSGIQWQIKKDEARTLV